MTFITGHPSHRIITDESRQIKIIPQYKKDLLYEHYKIYG